MPKKATFTITVSPTPATPVSVAYATRDGTAKAADGDYTATSGTLTFAAGVATRTVEVAVADPTAAEPEELFYLDVAWAASGANTVARGTGACAIPAGGSGTIEILPVVVSGKGDWYDRFDWIYRTLKNPDYGFWGPPSGAVANRMPYHSVQRLIAEAPDHGHESVSETASFWGRLEAWKIAMTGETTGFASMWNAIEAHYIPNAVNQPVGTYTPASPAGYTPEGDTPQAYPMLADASVSVGADPLATALAATYGDQRMYLMHWLVDVDGVFGFHNGDGSTKGVFINNYQRGPQESNWETVTHPEWEDWTQGGNTYGYLPIFSKSKPTYSEAQFEYGKQWRYTCAPDAEVRLISSSWWASVFAAEHTTDTATQNAKAMKMGDYLRYALYDKYFRPIGSFDGSGNHKLVSWYVSWGGEIPAAGRSSSWGFRIGSSEIHHGYNGVDIAYMMSPDGGGWSPSTAGAGTQWRDSLLRQFEMLRWLQSPEGPIAGGVSNSWNGRYETPSDGRQNATFYDMFYTYAPVWHDPPSNNWVGFQFWGLERVASLYVIVAGKTGALDADLRTKCGVILDRFVNWLLDHVTADADHLSLPTSLSWTSATAVSGQTTTAPNHEGVYEYIPSLKWPGTSPDYAAFWNASAVPNPNLRCFIAASGLDIGSAASAAQLLIQYAAAKRKAGGALTDTIPLGAHTVRQALDTARAILDHLWNRCRDTRGFTTDETRSDYSRYNDPIHLPQGFDGNMPNGDRLLNGASTFSSIRSFLRSDPDWPKIQTYLEGGSPPTFRYNRFWHSTEIAVGFAMLHRHFGDVVYS